MKRIILIVAAITLNLSAIAFNSNDVHCPKLRDCKIMIMYQGSLITAEATLANGTVVKVDGTVIRKDGSKMVLNDGECISKDGSEIA